MKENMTFGEYIQECELFEYSKEYFDLVKESGEMTLMELYLDSQDFITENAELLPDAVKTTLICESATYNESMIQAYEEKAGGFWSKIVNLGKAIGSAILRFLKRIANVFTGSQENQITKLKEEAKALLADKEKISAWKQDTINDLKVKLDQVVKSQEATQQNLDKANQDIESGKKREQTLTIAWNKSVAENSSLRELNQILVSHISGDDNLKYQLNQIEAYLSSRVTVKGPQLLFGWGDFFDSAASLIDQYTSGLRFRKKDEAHTAKSKRPDSFAAMDQLSSKIKAARGTYVQETFDFDNIEKIVKRLESDLIPRWNGALDKLANKSEEATGAGISHDNDEDKTAKAAAKSRYGAKEQSTAGAGFTMISAEATGVHKEIMDLVKELKVGSHDLMTSLNQLANERQIAIKKQQQVQRIVAAALGTG